MEPYPPIGSTGELFLDLLLVLLFIIIAGIFVAAEIALISLRESQLRQLEAAGAKPKRTQRLATLMKNPNRFLAAAQVGVTFCGFPQPLWDRSGWVPHLSSRSSSVGEYLVGSARQFRWYS